MSKNPYRQDREELKELIQQYNNLKEGKSHSFIDEEGFERIIDYYDDKDQFSLALEAAEFGIEQYGWSASLLLRKADILISLRRYKDSLEVLEYAELFDSTDSTLFILKTDAYLALDMQEKAAAVLETAIQTFEGEDRLELLFELADVYDDYENFEKVFDCLKMILESDPSNEEALYKICFWTDFTGRNEESITLHQWIVDEFPFNELAWFNLGAGYQGLKLYEKAIDAYSYAVAIDEKFDYAYRNMGDAFIKLRKFKEAIEVLEKVIELARPEAVIYEAIGHCHDKQGNFAQARFNYKKASHLSPEDGHMHYKIACTYMNEAHWQNAIKCLETAIRVSKALPEYSLALGQCHMELDQLDLAITHFGQVIRTRPKNVNGWLEFLKCLYLAEMHTEGLEYASFAYEQTDQKPIFLYYKSMFLFAKGKTKQALIMLETALTTNAKLMRKFIEMDPAILQHQKVVELIARYKKKK